jgi:hypothetical protein
MFDRIRFGLGAGVGGPPYSDAGTAGTGLPHVGVLVAYDRQQIRLTAQGFFGAAAPGSEIWSWGLKLSGATDFDATAALAELDMTELSDAIADFHQDATMTISSSCKYVTLKAAALDINGDYLTDAREFQGNGTTGFGGGVAGRNPNQVALVVSLRTVTSIGVATRGRFYVPGIVPTLNADGRVVSATVLAFSVAADTMLSRINTETLSMTEACQLQLMSDVGTSTPRSRTVTELRVGDVLDTMRSRRNALTEAYQVQPIVFA